MKSIFFLFFLLTVILTLTFSIAHLTTFNQAFGSTEKSNFNKENSLNCGEIGPHLLVKVVTEKGTEKVLADFKRFANDKVIVSETSYRD